MHLTLGALLLFQIAASLGGVVRIDGHRPNDRTCRVELLHLGTLVNEQLLPADGHFQFRFIEPGPYLVTVDCAGLPETTNRVTVLGNSGDDDISLNLYKPAE